MNSKQTNKNLIQIEATKERSENRSNRHKKTLVTLITEDIGTARINPAILDRKKKTQLYKLIGGYTKIQRRVNKEQKVIIQIQEKTRQAQLRSLQKGIIPKTHIYYTLNKEDTDKPFESVYRYYNDLNNGNYYTVEI